MTHPGEPPYAGPPPPGPPRYQGEPPYQGQVPYPGQPYPGPPPYQGERAYPGQPPFAGQPYQQPPAYQAQPPYQAQPYYPGYPPPGYGYPGQPGGYPPVPRGMVLIPGQPLLQAASAGQRFLGRFIDSVGYLVLLGGAITGIVFIVASAVHDSQGSVDYSYGYPTATDSTVGLRILWIYPILGALLLVIAAYEWLMVGLRGATVGDRIAGVRFVNTRDGGRPGLGRSAGRIAMFTGGFVVCYGLPTLLLWLSIFFDDTGRLQGWADKACSLQAITVRSR